MVLVIVNTPIRPGCQDATTGRRAGLWRDHASAESPVLSIPQLAICRSHCLLAQRLLLPNSWERGVVTG